MCDEHTTTGGLSRRQVLQGAVALAALAGWGGTGRRASAALSPAVTNAAGLTARAMAMHLHASSSEGVGSVRSQLAQAATHGFDVAWFTDHDWRRRRLLFRQSYSFTANEPQLGGTWKVVKLANTGSLAAGSGAALVTSPVSPTDPATRKGSLRLRATSKGPAAASVRQKIDATGSSRANFRGRIAGRTISVDALPARSGPNAWGEVLLRLSHHPASGSRPAGVSTVLYRLRTDIPTRVTGAAGLSGTVDVPVVPGSWQTITLDPTADAALLWPDSDPRDNSLNEIEFHAVSRRRAVAEVFVGHLRFAETAGYDAVGVESELLAGYASAVPGVLGLNGTEISLAQHMNQYGGPQEPFDYGDVAGLGTDLGDLRAAISAHVHALGGLACINHPFKPGDGGSNITARGVALDLLTGQLHGADLIEVGIMSKGTNGRFADHLAAWDAVSRNGLFLTGNGGSDDHSGQNWATQANRFYTSAWTATLDERSLLAALGAGRCYVGYLGGFGGSIDTVVDDLAPMGSVAMGPATSRSMRIDVTGLPAGGAVEVLRGDVDYAGTADPSPNTSVVATLGETDLATGAPLVVDATDECFYRVQVVTASGSVVAFGQPTWLLHAPPPTGVPDVRLVAA